MVERAMRGRCSRRAVTLGLATVAGAGIHPARAAQVGAPPSLAGDCGREPGVQLLLDWRAGKPVMTIDQLLPPPTWTLYSHPTMPLLFRHPPDWIAQSLWADSFTPAGAPIWRDAPPPLPQLTLARVVAPAGDAGFEFAVGNIQGQPMPPDLVALVAKQGVLGENPALTPICAYVDPEGIAPNWFSADRAGAFVLVSSGTAIGLPSPFLPATNVAYRNIVGPQPQFEELMRAVFLPILFQFLGGGAPDEGDGDGGDDGGDGDDGEG